MYDAPYQAHKLLVSLAETQVPIELAVVNAERGLSVPDPRKVYDSIVPLEKFSTPSVPCIEVRQPEGFVDVDGGAQATTTLEIWVLATIGVKRAEELTDHAMAYLTALARTYAYGEGRQGGVYRYELSQVSSSPPYSMEGTQLMTVGVQVTVSLIEDI